jgi:hypothetical protein
MTVRFGRLSAASLVATKPALDGLSIQEAEGTDRALGVSTLYSRTRVAL